MFQRGDSLWVLFFLTCHLSASWMGYVLCTSSECTTLFWLRVNDKKFRQQFQCSDVNLSYESCDKTSLPQMFGGLGICDTNRLSSPRLSLPVPYVQASLFGWNLNLMHWWSEFSVACSRGKHASWWNARFAYVVGWDFLWGSNVHIFLIRYQFTSHKDGDKGQVHSGAWIKVVLPLNLDLHLDYDHYIFQPTSVETTGAFGPLTLKLL